MPRQEGSAGLPTGCRGRLRVELRDRLLAERGSADLSGSCPGAAREHSGNYPGAVPELSAEPVLKAQRRPRERSHEAPRQAPRGSVRCPEGRESPWTGRGEEEEFLGRGWKGKILWWMVQRGNPWINYSKRGALEGAAQWEMVWTGGIEGEPWESHGTGETLGKVEQGKPMVSQSKGQRLEWVFTGRLLGQRVQQENPWAQA